MKNPCLQTNEPKVVNLILLCSGARAASNKEKPVRNLKLKELQFPVSSFLPFLKMGVTLALSHSSGTSLSHCDPDIKSGFKISSTSNLRTHGCITPGPMDLCMSSKGSLTPSSLRMSLAPMFRLQTKNCFLIILFS